MSVSLSSTIRRRDALSSEEIDDAIVVAALANETGTWCYGMESVAKEIWQLLYVPRTVGDLCRALVDRYHVDQEQCEREVLEFVEELSREGLIETS